MFNKNVNYFFTVTYLYSDNLMIFWPNLTLNKYMQHTTSFQK